MWLVCHEDKTVPAEMQSRKVVSRGSKVRCLKFFNCNYKNKTLFKINFPFFHNLILLFSRRLVYFIFCPPASTKWQVIETDPAHHAAKVGDKADLCAIRSLCSTFIWSRRKKSHFFTEQRFKSFIPRTRFF